MKKPLNIKKFLLPNIPYVFIALFATKLGQAWRLAPGTDFSGKALHLMEGFATAFSSLVPSFHPIDLCVGVAAALLIRLIVYVKGKNAKKFRKNLEYGSARWGKPEDIAPYVDPKFENNVILTQTERLMMPVSPAFTCSRRLNAGISFSYCAAISSRSGRGPTMLISPRRILKICGSSSSRMGRMTRPTGVIRSSWSAARRATPSFSASTRMERNFDLWFWR